MHEQVRADVRDRYYQGIGMITVAASILEWELALTAYFAQGSPRGVNWPDVLNKPGGAVGAFRRAAKECPVPGIVAAGRRADRLLAARGRLVHEIVGFNGDGLEPGATDIAEGVIVLHPATRETRPLPDMREFESLRTRIADCTDEVRQLRFPIMRWSHPEVFSDSVRTDNDDHS